MNVLKIKKRLSELGFTQYEISLDLSLPRSILCHFFAGRRAKIGKRNRALIYRWLIEHGVIPPPKLRPRHQCNHPGCYSVHVIKTKPPKAPAVRQDSAEGITSRDCPVKEQDA